MLPVSAMSISCLQVHTYMSDTATCTTPTAACRKILVAGSVGPTSKSLSLSPDVADPGYRPYSFDQMRDAYREQIQALLDGISLLVVAGGLGGGTASGGLRTVASLARSAGIPTVFLVTTPFSFESYNRRKNAEDCISELMPITDILLTIPNDILFVKLPFLCLLILQDNQE